MKWTEIRQTYPNQWLIIEAIEVETTSENQRQLKKIAVVERCLDSNAAMQSYRRLHQQFPFREFYYVHTSREVLDIREQSWVGIRGSHAILPPMPHPTFGVLPPPAVLA